MTKIFRKEKHEMVTREEALAFCLSFPGTFRDMPFHDPNWTVVRRTESRKIFACVFERRGKIWINIKTDPEWRDFWRNAFPSVIPAYHMNKEHWSSIILDGSVPDCDIKRLIGESYDLTGGKRGGKETGKQSAFAEKVFQAVAAVPEGRVATYGQIARLAGSPRAARAVGNLLRENTDPSLPCHRVVSSQGQLAPEGTFGEAGEQERRLRAEGVETANGKVNLKRWQMGK